MKSTIRMFKAVPVADSDLHQNASSEILTETIKRGFVFAPSVIANYNETELKDLIHIVEKEVGLSAEKMNNTLHKSWEKVANAPEIQLVIEQMIHYFTTYGFEALGIYNEDSVYIPNEKLDIPEIDISKIKLTVIKGYTQNELKEKICALLETGIALGNQSVKDSVEICKLVKVGAKDINKMKNKEVKVVLYDHFNTVPENANEFLRFVMYKVLGNPMIIKSKRIVAKIKESPELENVSKFFSTYEKLYGLEKLAGIFLRFKPIFLALKSGNDMSHTINKIRRLSKVYHKPMPEDFLNEITGKIKNGKTIDRDKLVSELSKVNTFRKIRLLYALNYRVSDTESILYKIRNGSSFATEFSFKNKDEAGNVFVVVMNSIIEDIRKNVEGKNILVSENIMYALPSTEKQFAGDLPAGSYVDVDSDIIIGVHWHNVDRHRIDLDLSLQSLTRKFGWDADYRSENRDIMFSGDITDAPGEKGASELYYVNRKNPELFLMNLNYYNFDEEVNVPFKIIVAKDNPKSNVLANMVDQNKVICSVKSSINNQQKILGFLDAKQGRFYFSEFNGSKSITAINDETSKHTIGYMKNSFKNAISLNSILRSAGANVVTEVEEDMTIDIDLSVENIEKDSIISLLS